MKSLTPSKIFITGTDTEIGKTTLTCALLHEWAKQGILCHGLKPIASGCTTSEQGLMNEDALLIQQFSSSPLSLDMINPIRFEAAIAPHIAAQQIGTTISKQQVIQAINAQISSDIILIEGFGGWLVPINHIDFMPEIVAATTPYVILVVGMRLGCLNHALLTQQAIKNAGCQLIGWFSNQIDPKMKVQNENVSTLKQLIRAPHLGHIPFQPSVSIENICQYIAPKPMQTLTQELLGASLLPEK